jgi:hypothetical protein
MKQDGKPASPRPQLNRRHFLRQSLVGALGPAAVRFMERAARAGDVTTRATGLAAKAVTRGPMHHFFGYYDKCPWDRTGRYLLATQIGFWGRQPRPGEALTIGMVDLHHDNRYVPLDTTLAWCWQQGTMLQWLGPGADRDVIYNDFRDGQYVSMIRDVHSGKTRTLPRPIYAVSADGRQAVSLDFDRVNRLRPGYGYMAAPEKHKEEAVPSDAGIYSMDLASGRSRLIVPIEWAAGNKPDERFRGAPHWFNHLQFNPSGTRFIFLHRWGEPGKRWYTRLYTARPDGTDIRLHSDTGMVSHFDWRDDDTILAWCTVKPGMNRFCLFNVNTNQTEVVAEGVLTQDGHCSCSLDRAWVLCDTYPDPANLQHLMLYRVADGKRFEIGAFHMPPTARGKPYRCDLHPRWNRDGTQVCIDSAHEPARQVYTIDVRTITHRRGPERGEAGGSVAKESPPLRVDGGFYTQQSY